VLGKAWESHLTRIASELEHDPAAEGAVEVLLAGCPDFVQSSWRSDSARYSRALELAEARAFTIALRSLIPSHQEFASALVARLREDPAGTDLAQAVEDLAAGRLEPVPTTEAPEPPRRQSGFVSRHVAYSPSISVEGSVSDLTGAALGSRKPPVAQPPKKYLITNRRGSGE
jgi:hypothetical protein